MIQEVGGGGVPYDARRSAYIQTYTHAEYKEHLRRGTGDAEDAKSQSQKTTRSCKPRSREAKPKARKKNKNGKKEKEKKTFKNTLPKGTSPAILTRMCSFPQNSGTLKMGGFLLVSIPYTTILKRLPSLKKPMYARFVWVNMVNLTPHRPGVTKIPPCLQGAASVLGWHRDRACHSELRSPEPHETGPSRAAMESTGHDHCNTKLACPGSFGPWQSEPDRRHSACATLPGSGHGTWCFHGPAQTVVLGGKRDVKALKDPGTCPGAYSDGSSIHFASCIPGKETSCPM